MNLADSLSVIRQFVFEEKAFTLPQLSGMLDKNWQGFETERARILKEGRFFGNDIDAADTIINQLIEKLNSFVVDKTPVRGGRYTFGTLVGYELAHVVLGSKTGASCDGRFAGDAFYASICSEKDKNGITAYLKSVAKINFTAMPSSVVVNLKLDRAMADSDEKLERLARLVEAYFKMGGVQLQINYVSQDDLINAQKCPEKYQNLRVRVTGFSGFFTQFDAALQNEIIKRTQHHA